MAAPTDYVAFFKLYEDVTDKTGTYDGTNNGGITFDGEKATFDGVDDYVSMPSIPLGITYSCSVWVSRSGHSTDILVGNDSTSNYSYIIAITDTTLYIGRKGDGSYGTVTHGLGSSFSMSHIVVIQDSGGNNLRCYVENVSKPITYTGTVIDTGHINTIGDWHNAPSALAYKGDVSSVKVYDYALTESEVGELYDEGSVPIPKATGSIIVGGSAKSTFPPKATGSIVIGGSATAFREVPKATGSIVIGGSAKATPLIPIATGSIVVGGSATAYMSVPETNTFSFVYSLQRSQAESSFKFIYSLEQPPIETKIITRVNT